MRVTNESLTCATKWVQAKSGWLNLTSTKWEIIWLWRQLSTEYLSQKQEDMSSNPGNREHVQSWTLQYASVFSSIPVVRSKVRMGKSRDPRRQARLLYTVVNCERPCFSQCRWWESTLDFDLWPPRVPCTWITQGSLLVCTYTHTSTYFIKTCKNINIYVKKAMKSYRDSIDVLLFHNHVRTCRGDHHAAMKNKWKIILCVSKAWGLLQ